MRIKPVLIAGTTGWAKRVPGVILCICIAVLASAGSLCLYRPEPTFRVQNETWSQPYFHQVYEPDIQSPDLTHYPFPDTGQQVKLTNQAVTPNAILWAGLMSNMEPPTGSIQIVFKDPQRWPNGGFPQRAEELRLQHELQQQIERQVAEHKMNVPTMADTDISTTVYVGWGTLTFTGVQGYNVYFHAANGYNGAINTFRDGSAAFISPPEQ
jgi:hypothetical protein